MSQLPPCPECAHKRNNTETAAAEAASLIRDASGNDLQDGDHDIDCKFDSIGAMKLKSEFVKKV